MVDENRLKRQLHGVGKVITNFKNGLGACLEYCTGFGKTYTATLVILEMLKGGSTRTTIIVVPTTPLKKQWEEKLKTDNITNAYVYTVQSIVSSRKKLTCDLLILDELHRYGGDLAYASYGAFVRIFEYITRRWTLGLSATKMRDDGVNSVLEKECPTVDTISMAEAVKNGWVSNFYEFNLAIELPITLKNILDGLNTKINKQYSYFNYNYGVLQKCLMGQNVFIPDNHFRGLKEVPYGALESEIMKTRKGEYIRLTKKGTYYYKRDYASVYANLMGLDVERIRVAAVLFNKYLQERKVFLYNSAPKVELIRQLITEINVKTIVFSESIQFTQQLGNALPDAVEYHSKVLASINKEGGKIGVERTKENNLKAFLDDKKRVLLTCKAINDGFDCDNVVMGIMASYTSSQIVLTQRKGRIVRLMKNGDNKMACIVNIYIKDSQEERWLKKAQRGSHNVLDVNLQQLLNITRNNIEI